MTAASQQAACVRRIRRFLELLLEVEAGQRPRRHLRRLVHPEFYQRLGQHPIGNGGPASIGAIRLQSRPGVHEAAVTVYRDLPDGTTRAGALAVAIRLVEGTWAVTEVAGPGQPSARSVEPVAEDDLQVVWSDLAVFDRIEVQETPKWQLPAGWQRPAHAA